MFKPLTLLIASLVLSGCVAGASSRYSCAEPGGVRCMSPVDVYEATHSASSLEGDAGKPAVASRSSDPTRTNTTTGIVTTSVGLMLDDGPDVQMDSIEPYRTPAQVLRIWIAAWEDEGGALHMPGFVYHEIESRRWSVGERSPDVSPQLTLIPRSTTPATNETEGTTP